MTRSGETVGNVYIGEEWTSAKLTQRDGGVSTIELLAKPSDGPVLVPGFIDFHCHGRRRSGRQIACPHAAHRTANLLVITATAPLSEVEAAILAMARAMEQQRDEKRKSFAASGMPDECSLQRQGNVDNATKEEFSHV